MHIDKTVSYCDFKMIDNINIRHACVLTKLFHIVNYVHRQSI